VRRVFVDSGGFFALLAAEDRFHDHARSLFSRANEERWRLATTNAVVVETCSLLLVRSRGGRRSALAFLDMVGDDAYHVERVRKREALYDPVRHRRLAFEFGTDQGTSSLAIMGWNLRHLGYPDQALVRAREAVALQRRLGHPFSLAFALSFQRVLHWLRREAAAQRDVGSEVMEIGRSQGFPLWLGVGGAYNAAARFTMGETGAIMEVMEGLAIAGETGNQGGAPALLAVLAEAQRAAGLHADALGTVETALAVSAATGQGRTTRTSTG
jgi:predicted nucleic acid-binding protein